MGGKQRQTRRAKRHASMRNYEVESIVGIVVEDGVKKYRVKWKDYDEVTVEPREHLTGCTELLTQFDAKHTTKDDVVEERDKGDSSEEEVYEVEKIITVRCRRNAIEYQVKWHAYNEITWEPVEHLSGCPELLRQFHVANAETMNRLYAQVEKICKKRKSPEGTYPIEKDAELSLELSQAERDQEEKCDQTHTSPDQMHTPLIGADHPETTARRSLFRREDLSELRHDATSFECLDSDGDDNDVLQEECDDTVVLCDEDDGDYGGDDTRATETVEEVIEVSGPHFGMHEKMLRAMAVDGWEKVKLKSKMKTSRNGKNWTDEGRIDPDDETLAGRSDLHPEQPTLSSSAQHAARSMKPLDLFFYFMTKRFWRLVQQETNRYELQSRSDRQNASFQLRDIASNIEPIRVSEILHFIALLISRTIAPMNTTLSDHWKTAPRGVVPPGTWSRVMSKQRWKEINRCLHFTNNEDPQASLDRAWKIRSVVEELQRTFKMGMEMGRWLAFDEMVIPSRSSRNGIRVYLKNKPHKYGTKLFALCCGITHYCKRIEVYCGMKKASQAVDTKSGAVAVVRNLKATYKTSEVNRCARRIVVTDREYTSIPLALRLLDMGYYSVGTIMPTRVAFPSFMKFKFKKAIPKNIKRGHYKLATSKISTAMRVCSWVDSKPVYFLATGMSAQRAQVSRKLRDGKKVPVVCPQLVVDYNKYMSGVDNHDQLRLQRYSIQRKMRCKKYYKNLFYGLLDMAIVNALIVHRVYADSVQERPLSHSEFLVQLHEELLLLTDKDFEDVDDTLEVVPAPSPARVNNDSPNSAFKIANTVHVLQKSDDKKESGQYKYRNCKVCSILRGTTIDNSPAPVFTTRFYCGDCSNTKGRIFLCNRVRRVDHGNSVSCFNIWHSMWKNGRELPTNAIRLRRVAEDSTQRDSMHSARSFHSVDSIGGISSTNSSVYL